MFLSDDPAASLYPMRIFLLTGIFAFWAAMFLVNDRERRQVFDWFCAGALGIIGLGEIIAWLVRGTYGPEVFQLFTRHPIPLGTLLILLSPGPLRLIVSQSSRMKPLGWALLLLGGLLIFLIHKRGAWLALAAMLAVGLMSLARRKKYLLLAILLIIGVLLPLQAHRRLTNLNPNIPHDLSILDRLELYNFALHIWKIHPLLGIGLRSYSQERYLPGYQLRNPELHNFPAAVATLHTFDNMLLTGLVEMGSLLTLIYLGLIIFILARYVRELRAGPQFLSLAGYRLLVLVGFAVHSMTYDSLVFPPVTWVFHVQLGLMAAYHAEETEGAAYPRAGVPGLSERY